ncbi:heme exporter protein CcmD [Phaeospirillum tilakii]|uniref:Heme exporter protein D n=1 Tax=Phaeospirillum tilakii TaxID=741673 RepID=A0ABW5CBX5_9PROT
MEALTAWFAMGGYASFVWPAYALTLAVLAAVLVISLRQLRQREAELEQLQGDRRARRGGGNGAAP